MNAKNANTCWIETSAGADQGVTWFCTGAQIRISQPKMERDNCDFDVTIKCASEQATISGIEIKKN